MSYTEEQVKAMQERANAGMGTLKARLAAQAGGILVAHGEQAMATVVSMEQTNPPAKKELRVQSVARALPKTQEERLNKTERRFLERLRLAGHQRIGIQSITLQIGFDCRYTPDFWTEKGGLITFWEVKGAFEREDAKIKLKVAAGMFPCFHFVKAVWAKGAWTETVISQ